MIGALIGDVVGSRFEWHNLKSKDFELFSKSCHYTDDSVMTIAIMKAFLESSSNYSDLSDKAILSMVSLGRKYPTCGYGGRFYQWIFSEEQEPYNSYGNGAAMRVSACGMVAESLEEAKEFSQIVTGCTHNHPEGLKGAEAVACAIFLAKSGMSKEEIREYILKNYYQISFTLDEIREDYSFDVSCQGSVPQALEAFFESHSFEDAIRNAISIGGDSDTIAAITGSIAGVYYGIPKEIEEMILSYFDEDLKSIVFSFEKKYGGSYGFREG